MDTGDLVQFMNCTGIDDIEFAQSFLEVCIISIWESGNILLAKWVGPHSICKSIPGVWRPASATCCHCSSRAG